MGGHRISILVLLTIGCMASREALAQGECIPGREEQVRACDKLSVIANWNQTYTSDCNYNPPPGWVIVDTQVSVHSSSNGSRSVSVIAGESSFASERDVKEAFKRVDDLLGEYTGEGGSSKYKAAIESKHDSMLRDVRRFSASHNTLQAIVRASGSGNIFDQWRGWETITVHARLRCLGVPDPESLVIAIVKDLGIEFGN